MRCFLSSLNDISSRLIHGSLKINSKKKKITRKSIRKEEKILIIKVWFIGCDGIES